MPGLVHRRASEVVLSDEAGRPAQADGDPAGTTPLHVSDARAPLRLMVGREAARRPACGIPGMR